MKLRLIVAWVVIAAGLASGQTFRGSIFGTVLDTKGTRVADANIKAVNVDTGMTRQTVTASDGRFSLSEVPIGTYDLVVTKDGFRILTTTSVPVRLGNPARVHVQLTPGEAARVMETPSNVPLTHVRSNNLGGTLGREVSDLPVNGRDFKKLLVLIPSVNADPSLVDNAPASPGIISVNGNRGRSNNFLLDGGDINDPFRNQPSFNENAVSGIPSTLLPLDSIDELSVMSNTNAQYGRNSGAIVNIVTRSGANDLHGSIFGFFRNSRLDARNFFNFRRDPITGAFLKKDVFQDSQFGGSAGGAVTPGKTFWFLTYEGQRERAGIPSLAMVPSQEQIAANTPAGGRNPIIQNILNLNPWGPLPLFGDAGPGSNTAATVEPETRATNGIDGALAKLDHRWGRNLLTGRIAFADDRQNSPVAILGGNMLPGFNTIAPTRAYNGLISLTHGISPHAIVEFRGGWNRFRLAATPEDKALNPAVLGLNTANTSFTRADYGLPSVSVRGFSSLGANNLDAQGRVDDTIQFATNFAVSQAKNDYKVGFEFRHTSVREYFNANQRGTLDFPSLAAFLAGVPSSGSQAFGNSHRNLYQNNYAFYLQDTYRYTEKVTVNYGVRWDYFGVIGEKNHLFSIFSPSIGLEPVGINGGPATLYLKDKNNLSPRLGAAYDVFGSGKTVLRAGWGLFYDQFSQDAFSGQVGFNTANAGAVFNGIGSRPVLYGSVDPLAFVTTTGSCGLNQIAVPGTASCTGPVYSSFSSSEVFSVAPHFSTPYVQNYNLNVEQQLGSRTVLMLAYVGSSGRKLLRYRDINQVSPVTGIRPFDSGPFTAPTGVSPGGAPFSHVYQLESQASSIFNSVQARLATRDLHGLVTSLNYTYGHSIDNASDSINYAPDQALPDNSYNPAAERSNSAFDVRHHFTWDFSYKFPSSKLLPRLTSGWAIAGLASVMTGLPFTVNDLGNFNGSGELVERPDLVGNPFQGKSTPYTFLNLSAFQAPCAAPNVANLTCASGRHFGSSGRNQFYGPRFGSLDLAFSKDTKLTERVSMQLRIDAFNVFNHPNFANPLWPNSIVDWTRNGIDPATGRGLGYLPLTVTTDVGAQNPYLGEGGPRNFQLGVRFSF